MFKAIKRFKKFFSLFVVIFFVLMLFTIGKIYPRNEISFGLTFSKKQAQNLGLDWKELYVLIFKDLGVKKIRLSAYWDEVEKVKNQFDWNDLDWQIKEAGKNNAQIILAVGARLPRWPECHLPDWVKNLNKKEREERTVYYIKKVINRYKNNKNIIAWQVENEPFLSQFGICPKFDKNFLDKEIQVVKSLDDRDIIITDSGELSDWVRASGRADIFGTTMYRDTYSKMLRAYIHYPIKPSFFRFKKNITSLFARPKKWIVIELQAEPWGRIPYQYLSAEERAKTMDLQKFKDMINFASQTGFKEFYLWGVEWWYWEKTKNNNPALWNEAKKLYE